MVRCLLRPAVCKERFDGFLEGRMMERRSVFLCLVVDSMEHRMGLVMVLEELSMDI
jgi:hypothetical protein